MRNPSYYDVRLFTLDLVEDRSEIRRIRRDAKMIEYLQPGLRQAFQVFGVERGRPSGIFAHHHGGFHVQAVNKKVLGGSAGQFRDAGRGQITVEGVFEIVVILSDVWGNDVGG